LSFFVSFPTTSSIGSFFLDEIGAPFGIA
jgi:hypothetical protein